LIYSCSKENLSQIDLNLEQEKIYVKNNIIHFKTMNDFVETIDYLMSVDRNKISEWEKSIGFKSSMRAYYENLDEPKQADLIERWSLIPDPVFASIVNDEGIYCIGDTIHKVTRYIEYLITDGDYAKLSLIDSRSSEEVNSSSIIAIPIKRELNNGNLKWIGWKSVEKTDICNLTDRRAQLKAWNMTYAAYASCGIRIVGRQYVKNFWGNWDWKDWYMDWAKVDGCARMNYYCLGNPGTVFEHCASNTGTDTKDVEKIIGYVVGAGCAVNCWWIHADYYYEDGGCEKHWYQEFE
jgi:hypothetical protein